MQTIEKVTFIYFKKFTNKIFLAKIYNPLQKQMAGVCVSNRRKYLCPVANGTTYSGQPTARLRGEGDSNSRILSDTSLLAIFSFLWATYTFFSFQKRKERADSRLARLTTPPSPLCDCF